MSAIESSDDPPDRLAITKSDKGLYRIFTHERRATPTEDRTDFVVNRFNPLGIDRLGATARFDKSGDSCAVVDRYDFDVVHEAAAPRASAVNEVAFVASNSFAMTGTTFSICSAECSLLIKKRRRAKRSGMAGWIMGWTLMSRSKSRWLKVTARTELPVMTGTIAAPMLEPTSRPALRANSTNSCELTRKRPTRSGSAWRSSRAVSAAVAIAGGIPTL